MELFEKYIYEIGLEILIRNHKKIYKKKESGKH
jgi:hypothetical protein